MLLLHGMIYGSRLVYKVDPSTDPRLLKGDLQSRSGLAFRRSSYFGFFTPYFERPRLRPTTP